VRIVYAQRTKSPSASDDALIASFTGRDYVVQVETGSLASIDWADVDLLVIGAPGTTYTAHENATSLNGYPVAILSLCRYTSRISLGMSTASTTVTVGLGGLTRTTAGASDPRAIFSVVYAQDAVSQTLTSLTSGTTLLYHNGNTSAAGICERIHNGYSRIHWGYHRFELASENFLTLFASYTTPPFRARLEATEQSDSGQILVNYMPPGGFLAEMDATEQGDQSQWSGAFFERRFVTVDVAEGDDTLEVFAEHDWISATVRSTASLIYECVLETDGFADLLVPISSWQATLQIGRKSYVQVVMPAFSGQLSDLIDRKNAGGEVVVYRVARFGVVENRVEMARAPIGEVRLDQGSTNKTITVSGYAQLEAPESPTVVALTSVRSLNISSGVRVRCAVDWSLRPGDTAEAVGQSFTASYINYYVMTSDQYMDVGERVI